MALMGPRRVMRSRFMGIRAMRRAVTASHAAQLRMPFAARSGVGASFTSGACVGVALGRTVGGSVGCERAWLVGPSGPGRSGSCRLASVDVSGW